jgi:hypothetical protein
MISDGRNQAKHHNQCSTIFALIVEDPVLTTSRYDVNGLLENVTDIPIQTHTIGDLQLNRANSKQTLHVYGSLQSRKATSEAANETPEERMQRTVEIPVL